MAILGIDAETRTRACGYTFLTKWSNIDAPQRSNMHNDTTLNSCKMLTC